MSGRENTMHLQKEQKRLEIVLPISLLIILALLVHDVPIPA